MNKNSNTKSKRKVQVAKIASIVFLITGSIALTSDGISLSVAAAHFIGSFACVLSIINYKYGLWEEFTTWINKYDSEP